MADTAEGMMSRQLPAPKTFAPSRDDVLSNLAFFFGDPAVPEKLRDYSEHHAMTYHFPDAYYGQNNRIRETLNNLILKSPQEWQTSVALPFVKIEGTTVEWDEIRFDVRLLQRVPYEGVSRMQTSLRRRHRDRVVRRGIGMTIESDFYATEAGRQHFRDQLTSIRYCVQETCNFDTLFAYLTSGNYDFRYDLSKGLRSRRSVRQSMAHEIMMYSIVQKEGLGLDKAVEEVKHRMSRYSVTPNMLVVPPQLLLYLATAPEEKIKYVEGGERAVANFEAGVAGYEARAFRGMGVFVSMPYEVSDDQDSVQMLQRSSQVGEFYRMMPPVTWDATKQLPPQYMDLLVFDEEMDQLKHITFEQALYATGYHPTRAGQGDAGSYVTTDIFKLGVANPGALPPKTDATYKLPATFVNKNNQDAWPTARAAVKAAVAKFLTANNLAAAAIPINAQFCKANEDFWADFDTALDDNVVGGCYIHSKTHPAVLVGLVNAGIWLPLCITITRPFIEHLMMSCVATVSGRDTGATLFGPADMQISANTSVKTIEGHYTCHTKSVITKPQNVYVMRDIMCSGYVAGANTRWFASADGAALIAPCDAMKVQQGLNDRLSFADDSSGEYASMLAFASSYNDEVNSSRDQVISISSRLLPWEVAKNADPEKKYFPSGIGGYNTYAGLWNLGQIHFGEDVRATENMAFMSQGSVNNSLCFIGPHRKYNPFAQNFYELVPGQGHFGPDAIPGDARWRRGESVSLKTARDSMVSLEVAAHSQLALRPANGV